MGNNEIGKPCFRISHTDESAAGFAVNGLFHLQEPHVYDGEKIIDPTASNQEIVMIYEEEPCKWKYPISVNLYQTVIKRGNRETVKFGF